MVYDWENKEDICYRMYIEEKKSLEEIMDYMKEHHKFAPRYVDAARRTSPYKTISSSVLTLHCKANARSKPSSSAGNSLPNKTPPTRMPPLSSE
jgi:hypothetical protein